MTESPENTPTKKIYGYIATICILLFLFQCMYMFLQWGDIEEGGSQEMEYLTMFLGIVGTIFLVFNRTA